MSQAFSLGHAAIDSVIDGRVHPPIYLSIVSCALSCSDTVLVGWLVDCMVTERYLCEVVFKKPVIVYNYPCAIKAFYMRRNDPGTDGAPGPTCAAMDVLVPGVGELIGGSVREGE